VNVSNLAAAAVPSQSHSGIDLLKMRNYGSAYKTDIKQIQNYWNIRLCVLESWYWTFCQRGLL